MSRLRFVSRLAVVVVLLFLAASWDATAAPRGSGAVQAERPISSLIQVWSWFVSLLGAPAPTADNGCGADPGGRCNPAPAADLGCTADPGGHCKADPTLDLGCHVDPGGHCTSVD